MLTPDPHLVNPPAVPFVQRPTRRRPAVRRAVVVPLVVMALVAAACGGTDATGGPGDDPGTTTSVGTDTGGTDNDGATTVAQPVPSAGCGTTAIRQVTAQRSTVDVDDPDGGDKRWYLRSTPTAHDGVTPLPLVVSFHGLSEGAEIHTAHSDLTPFAEENGFVVAFPNGTGIPLRWNVLPTDDDVTLDTGNDLAYVDAMVAQLADELCLDLSAVYATGLSNGAGMASLVACERNDVFAAVAPVAGLRPPLSCGDANTMPVLSFHGTADPILLYNGGVADIGSLLTGTAAPAPPPADIDGPGYPASARAWARHNGCDPDPAETTIGDDVIRWVFDCPEGNDVEFYIVVDGGHTWPSSDFSVTIESIAGPTTFTVSANEVMWEFFSRHRLPVA